jgi:uncharacterized coiled-coil protein SlyX
MLAPFAAAEAADPADEAVARLEALKQQLAEQTRRLEELKRSVAEQEASLNALRRAVAESDLATQRGGTGTPAPPAQVAQAQPSTQPSAPTPVGQAPQEESAPKVAPIFEQPGVLTPRGQFILEPSLQYAYSTSNRVALIGYTVIPAIVVGLIDVRETKRNTFIGTLTGRYGVTNRFELEAKVPYVYRSDTAVGREFLEGASFNSVIFDADGSGLGDVEATARYQLNEGGATGPYFVGSLRFKSRTGTDPFEITTAKNVLGFRDEFAQTELATGSGFYSLQPALTVLYPSDPAVFFGSLSYIYNFKRNNVVRNTDEGPEEIGTVAPGHIWGFNFGMGLALSEKASFSIGFDGASVGKTEINGRTAPDAVRFQLGTLLLGYSYRLDAKRTLNVSLGAGLTTDTPDVTLTVRLPVAM